MIIYKIENKINGKVYIGQTVRGLDRRFKEHCKKARCAALHSAIIKYGVENFAAEVVETVESIELLNEREQYWVAFYSSLSPKGYNLTSGGENGRIASESTKQKLSDLLKGKPKESHPAFGTKRTEEFSRNQSERMKHRIITDETRKNMSLAASKRRTNIKKCVLQNENNESIEFNSIKEAASFLGCTGSNLVRYIKNNKPIKNYKIIVKDK